MNDAPDPIDPIDLDVADLNELLASMHQVREELEARVEEQKATILYLAKKRDDLQPRVLELEARLSERRRMMGEEE